jgi:predicted TPR repeat methyltransferase
LIENGEKRKLRFHDYDELYKKPGLYEQLFYERLKCTSPQKIAEVLNYCVQQSDESIMELCVLDLGAGNGMMGEALNKYGVSRLIGADIIEEAKIVADRDRVGLYDDYYVVDFCQLSEQQRYDIASWSLNTLTVVAALGFGDIPPQAFIEGFNLIQSEGWVAFNIKDTFLDYKDDSGFSKTIRELIFSEYLDLYYIERYRHRFSMDGKPLFYFAVAGRKTADVPANFLESIGAT